MYIDSHVHCRDEEEKEKETISHALHVAEDSGVSAIFDIGNLKNSPVTTRQRVLERFELARAADSPVFYGAYVILTKDKEQVREAVETWREFFPRTPRARNGVIGLKMFAGQSTGNCGIVELEEQLDVDSWLVEFDFTGVKAVHCEKESRMNPSSWDPKNPVTHSIARPEVSEIISISDQIEVYKRTKAKYHLEIKHVTTPYSVRLVNNTKKEIRISSEVCPRNLLLGNNVMFGPDGIMYKVNPPLRHPLTRLNLLECFLRGEIDTLATDHSPHTYEDKVKRYSSGMPGIASWPDSTEILKHLGASQDLINTTAFYRVNQIYGLNFSRLNLSVKKGAHLGEYVMDPYASLKRPA